MKKIFMPAVTLTAVFLSLNFCLAQEQGSVSSVFCTHWEGRDEFGNGKKFYFPEEGNVSLVDNDGASMGTYSQSDSRIYMNVKKLKSVDEYLTEEYTGAISGNHMEGTYELPAGTTVKWEASKESGYCDGQRSISPKGSDEFSFQLIGGKSQTVEISSDTAGLVLYVYDDAGNLAGQQEETDMGIGGIAEVKLSPSYTADYKIKVINKEDSPQEYMISVF